MKTLFESVKTALEAMPELESVMLFRGQMRYGEIRQELPIRYPAALIEIKVDEYQTNADETQTGKGRLIIRILEHELNIDDADFFNLRQVVNAALTGLRNDDEFSALVRITEEMDPDFDAVNVWSITYQCDFKDNTAQKTYVAVNADLGTVTPVI